MVTALTFSLLAMLLARGTSAIEAPIPGYSVESIAWSVTPSPGAEPQVFEGTMEQVFSSILKINPNFHTDFGLVNITTAHHLAKRDTTTLIEKRDVVNCNPNPDWHSAYLNGIQQGITYLRGVPGQPQRGPGPGSCGRVSCSYECAIWWCNDNDFTKVLPSFNNIADGAQVIVNECTTTDPISNLYKFVRGQDFHSDNWNVIVRLDSSDGC